MIKIIKTAKTIKNNTIELIETQNTNYDKTILIIGVFHGEEPQGEYLIKEYLKTNPTDIKNKLLIIPCLNPDGKAKNKRQNANGIDLNRNFPTKNWKKTDNPDYFGGTSPASEIETKFMIEILSDYKIDAILSIHAPFKIVNYDGPAKELAQKISQITGYPVQADIGYPTPGSFGNYAGVERQIPTITLELPEDDKNEHLWIVNKPVFDYLANEY
ncbi:murein peptide amidase A [bacterium]|nr:murein peptide amidase A [bacterium]